MKLNKKTKPKEINDELFYAIFSPDGELQVRSIADTKEDAWYYLTLHEAFSKSDYEKIGFNIQKVVITVKVV